MKWYSMKDNVPPFGTPCLVNDSSNYDLGFNVAEWTGKAWWYIEDSSSYTCEDVTHFCIPDPIPIEE